MLFDFEVDAIHRLVALAQQVEEHRELARETVRHARCHADLAAIYESISRAWPPGAKAIDAETGEVKVLVDKLTPQQETVVRDASARMRDLVGRFSRDLPSDAEERLMVHAPYIRAHGGAAKTAELMFNRVRDRELKAGGALSKFRGVVSGVYDRRAHEDPFPSATGAAGDGGRASDEIAWLWRLIHRYASLQFRRSANVPRDAMKRLIMQIEQCVRRTEQLGAPHASGGPRDTIDMLLRSLTGGASPPR